MLMLYDAAFAIFLRQRCHYFIDADFRPLQLLLLLLISAIFATLR